VVQVVVMRGLLQLLIMGAVAIYQKNSFIGPTWMFRFILFLVSNLFFYRYFCVGFTVFYFDITLDVDIYTGAAPLSSSLLAQHSDP